MRLSKSHDVQIGCLYASGNTQRQIAEFFGVSQTAIMRRMRTIGIPARSDWYQQTPRHEHSPNWKGNEATYTAFHLRIRKVKGSPKLCEMCGASDPLKTYDWANLSGRLHDLGDYRRMCRSCHRKFDYDFGRIGRELTAECLRLREENAALRSQLEIILGAGKSEAPAEPSQQPELFPGEQE